MPTDDPHYDVAISFLSKDETTANALYQKLREGLQVFFYPRNQEELAGTDGLESMRKPFFDDSRVMVVLYREMWGKTPWTRVEEAAIKDGCLEHGWRRLLFVNLESTDTFPLWLPHTHIRLNYADFGLDQAVGAIKARVQEHGGQYLPLTPLKQAEILKADQQFRSDKLRMNSSQEGIQGVLNSVAELFRQVDKHCGEINEKGSLLEIKCSQSFQDHKSCSMTDGHVGLTIHWSQRFSNTLDRASLIVHEYNGGLIPREELGQRMQLIPPEKLTELKYVPDLSRAREYVWKQEGKNEVLSSPALAEQLLIRFMKLADRYDRGELKNRLFD